jgi:DNA/RNA endonuclease G, NUC1
MGRIKTVKKINFCAVNLMMLLLFFSITLLPQAKISKDNRNNINVSLGIPTDSTPEDDYIIFRPQYVLSYNPDRNVANWVSWELNAKWFGKSGRYKGKFITDNSLPKDFYRVKHEDYSNSGYDRGHMVRSQERSCTPADNKSTFLLTNVLPQQPDLNRGVWLRFEEYCADLCLKENKELFIIAGGIFHKDNSIDDLIAIPDSCFKIVVILDKGKTVKDIDKNTQAIAVVMPNEQGIRDAPWENYKTTIRRIEYSTGYNFLSNLRKDIQDAIETKK